MDLMTRRRLMGSMANGLPTYLNHYSFVPTENVKSVQINVGDDFTQMVITSNCPTSGTGVDVVTTAIVCITEGAFFANGSRIILRKVNGSFDYYGQTSSGQIWNYSNGILTLEWTSNFYLGAGIRYDCFYR